MEQHTTTSHTCKSITRAATAVVAVPVAPVRQALDVAVAIPKHVVVAPRSALLVATSTSTTATTSSMPHEALTSMRVPLARAKVTLVALVSSASVAALVRAVKAETRASARPTRAAPSSVAVLHTLAVVVAHVPVGAASRAATRALLSSAECAAAGLVVVVVLVLKFKFEQLSNVVVVVHLSSPHSSDRGRRRLK